MKLGSSREILEKHSNIKFHENPSSRSRVVPCRTEGQTKRHDEVNRHLCRFSNAPNIGQDQI